MGLGVQLRGVSAGKEEYRSSFLHAGCRMLQPVSCKTFDIGAVKISLVLPKLGSETLHSAPNLCPKLALTNRKIFRQIYEMIRQAERCVTL